jgi:hypothetical protein
LEITCNQHSQHNGIARASLRLQIPKKHIVILPNIATITKLSKFESPMDPSFYYSDSIEDNWTQA